MSFQDAVKRVEAVEDDPNLFFPAQGRCSSSVVKSERSAATPSDQLTDKILWNNACAEFVFGAQDRLHSVDGQKALAWLTDVRKLSIKTIWKFGIGYNPADAYHPRHAWGLPPKYRQSGQPLDLKIPRGITIPNVHKNDFVELRIRRPQAQQNYWVVAGSDHGSLFSSDRIVSGQPVALCEAEIDAMSIWSACGDIVSPVATGGTSQAQRAEWVELLSLAPVVLVAFDDDESGDTGAQWWLDRLPNARRLRPTANDVNDMLIGGLDVAKWIGDN